MWTSEMKCSWKADVATYSNTQRPRIALPMLHFTPCLYISQLPRYRQRLLSWCRPNPTLYPQESRHLLSSHLATNGPIEIGSDGGLNTNRGTFGYVLGIPNMVSGKGRVLLMGTQHCPVQIFWNYLDMPEHSNCCFFFGKWAVSNQRMVGC